MKMEGKSRITYRDQTPSVMEGFDSNLYKRYKNDKTVSPTAFFEKICKVENGCTKDEEPVSEENHEKENKLMREISNLRNNIEAKSDDKNLSRLENTNHKSCEFFGNDNMNPVTSPKKNMEFPETILAIKNIQCFSENLAQQQKVRNPQKIILVIDERNSYLKTEEIGDNIKVLKAGYLSLKDASSYLEKNQALGNGSLIIFLCGIYSLINSEHVKTCIKSECQIPLVKYSVNRNMFGTKFITTALRLHEHILNQTKEDQVMFCDLIPINLTNRILRKCDNNHALRYDTSSEVYAEMLKTIEGYNTFVKDHSRIMGYNSLNLLQNAFPPKSHVPLSLDLYSDYQDIDSALMTKYMAGFIKALLLAMKQCRVEPVSIKKCLVKPATVKECLVKPATVKECPVKPVTVKKCLVKPATVKECLVKPATVKECLVKPATVKEYLGKPATVKECLVKPATVKECLGKPATVKEYLVKPATVKECLAKPANVKECLVKPATVKECLTKTATVAECLVKPANVKECLVKPATIKEYLVKPVTVKECLGKPATVKEYIVKPATVKECLAKPTNVKECLVKPANVKECLVKPATVKECLVKPATVKECLVKPATVKECLVKPATVKECLAEPTAIKMEPPTIKECLVKHTTKRNMEDATIKEHLVEPTDIKKCRVETVDTVLKDVPDAIPNGFAKTSTEKKLFRKVIIITYPHYVEYMKIFSGPNVEICIIRQTGIDGIISAIKEKSVNNLEHTLWLAHIGFHSVAKIVPDETCTPSCASMLENIVPHNVFLQSKDWLLDFHSHLVFLMEMVKSCLCPKSSFFIIPPCPPVVWNGMKNHKEYHKVIQQENQEDYKWIYFIKGKKWTNFLMLFTSFSKEIICFTLAQLEKLTIPKKSLEDYYKFIKNDWHVQLHVHSMKIKFDKLTAWKNAVHGFIMDCLTVNDTHILESQIYSETIRNTKALQICEYNIKSASPDSLIPNKLCSPNNSLDNARKYDHLVFIGCRELLNLIPCEKGFPNSISKVDTSTSLDWLDIKLKLDSFKSLAFKKNILFLIMGSVKLLGTVNREILCTQLKCKNPLYYLTLNKERVSSSFEEVMNQIKLLLSYIRICFPGKSEVFLLPLFPFKCSRKINIKNVTHHNIVHNKNHENRVSCLIDLDNTKWDKISQAFNIVWEKEMSSLLKGIELKFENVMKTHFPYDEGILVGRRFWIEHASVIDLEEFLIQRCKFFLKHFIRMACPFVNFKSDYESALIFELTESNTSINHQNLNTKKDISAESQRKKGTVNNFYESSRVSSSINHKDIEVQSENKNRRIFPSNKGERNIVASDLTNSKIYQPKPNDFQTTFKDKPKNNMNTKFELNMCEVQRVRGNQPFRYAYVVGSENLKEILNKKVNVQHVHHEFTSESSVNDVPIILSKLGNIQNNSICFLALGLHSLVEKLLISPACKKFNCANPMNVMNLNVCKENSDEIESFVTKKIKRLMLIVSKLSNHLPVVVMPFFPEMICCDDGCSYMKHSVFHSIANFGSYVVYGKMQKWVICSDIVKNLWSNFVKTNYEKYFTSNAMNTYIEKQMNVLIFEENVIKYSFACPEISKWESILTAFFNILVDKFKIEKISRSEKSFKESKYSKSTYIHHSDEVNDSKKLITHQMNAHNAKPCLNDIPRRPRTYASDLPKDSRKRSRSPSSSKKLSEKKLKSDHLKPREAPKKMSVSKDHKSKVEDKDNSNEIVIIHESDPLIFILGQSMYEEFVKEKDRLREALNDEYDIFNDMPELNHKYESTQKDFKSKYRKAYGEGRDEEHKEKHWKIFWQKKLKYLKKNEWKERVDYLVNNYKLKSKELVSENQELSVKAKLDLLDKPEEKSCFSQVLKEDSEKYRETSLASHSSHKMPTTIKTYPLDKMVSETTCNESSVESSANSDTSIPHSISSRAVESPTQNSSINLLHSINNGSELVEQNNSNLSTKFSVDGTLNLLEQLSSKLGILGPALVGICKCAKEYGIETTKGLHLFTDEENIILFQMVIDKLTSLKSTSAQSEIPILCQTVDWLTMLLNYAKSKCSDQQVGINLNLKSIATASLNTSSSFTLNLIKNAFIYEGNLNPTNEEINDAYLKVCSMHFDMTSS